METMKKIFIILTILLIGCSQFSTDYSNIKVIEAVDGDTIRLANGRLVRYIGIDTPEVRIKEGGSFRYQPQPFALDAKQLNKELVEGRSVRIEFDVDHTDKYGRLLGYCFIGDTFVNAKLIEEGYAVLYTIPPNVKYADLLYKMQTQARNQGRGLWGAYEVISHLDAGRYINQIRTVRGRVLNTYKSPKCVFLNFGADYKTDFTLVIFNNSLDAFYQRGIQPENFYRGKTVEATGKIRQYNGPEIIVNTPYEIEIIE